MQAEEVFGGLGPTLKWAIERGKVDYLGRTRNVELQPKKQSVNMELVGERNKNHIELRPSWRSQKGLLKIDLIISFDGRIQLRLSHESQRKHSDMGIR